LFDKAHACIIPEYSLVDMGGASFNPI